MKPGAYRLSLEVMDSTSGRSGAQREMLAVENFSGAQLSMSSIVLAVADSSNPHLILHRENEVALTPSLSQKFLAGQQIYVYYEIYNLALDENGQSRYRLEYVVEPVQENPSFVSRAVVRLGKIFGLRQQSTAIGSAFEASGARREERLYQSVEILGQPSGEYALTLRLDDRIAGLSTSRRAIFAINQKSKNKD
jgi:hypothetical protein